jgi:hypothetical protein
VNSLGGGLIRQQAHSVEKILMTRSCDKAEGGGGDAMFLFLETCIAGESRKEV